MDTIQLGIDIKCVMFVESDCLAIQKLRAKIFLLMIDPVVGIVVLKINKQVWDMQLYNEKPAVSVHRILKFDAYMVMTNFLI